MKRNEHGGLKGRIALTDYVVNTDAPTERPVSKRGKCYAEPMRRDMPDELRARILRALVEHIETHGLSPDGFSVHRTALEQLSHERLSHIPATTILRAVQVLVAEGVLVQVGRETVGFA